MSILSIIRGVFDSQGGCYQKACSIYREPERRPDTCLSGCGWSSPGNRRWLLQARGRGAVLSRPVVDAGREPDSDEGRASAVGGGGVCRVASAHRLGGARPHGEALARACGVSKRGGRGELCADGPVRRPARQADGCGLSHDADQHSADVAWAI